MARINIEDSIYKDKRFFKLALKLGSQEAAIGSLVMAWSIAQKYWLSNGAGIPKPVWDEQELKNEIIETGMAREEDGFIHVCGCEKQFSWLLQKKVAGKSGGIRSGMVRSRNHSGKIEADRSVAQAGEPSSSSSSSSSKNKDKYIREGLKICLEEYQRTLDHFKIKRDAKSGEYKLASLGSRFGFEDLTRAIAGMRREKRTETFNPADHFTLDRLTKHFEKFLNLGAKHGINSSVESGEGHHGENTNRPAVSADWNPDTAPPELLEILKRTASA